MIKTFTFAIMHFTVAFGVAYALTGDVVVGGAVALVEPAVNTLGYHLHERLWNRLGRRERSPRSRASGVAMAT
jgi:uncharacterized membrane protein